jgi:hypothetical protein
MQACPGPTWAVRVVFALCLCLVGCGSSPISPVQAAPATVAYVWANSFPVSAGGPTPTIEEFSISSPNPATPIGTLSLPNSCGPGPIATDSAGNLYVACSLTSSPPEILVYPPNSSGVATPLRTLHLNSAYYEIETLAVDASDQLYVGALENSDQVAFSVAVFPANASGSAMPLRSILLPANSQLVDVTVDLSGNVYVAGFPIYVGSSGPSGFVNVYSTSTALLRTLELPYFVDGVAIDKKGTIFISAQVGPNYTSVIELQEFAPEAVGPSPPASSMNLTSALAPGSFPGGGPVRLDSAGNIFTPLISGKSEQDRFVLYGFGQAPENTPTFPIAQVSQNGYDSSFALH